MICLGATKRKITNQKQTNQRQKIYRGINDKSSLLMLKKGYTMNPPAQIIFHQQFIVEDLTISFAGTKVKWGGVVNLKKLRAPLRQLIDLGQCYIEVYPDNCIKPQQGQQLNRECVATLKSMRKVNRTLLKKACMDNGCELLSINGDRKQFTVEIPHFTKYSFNSVENDDEKTIRPNGDENRQQSLVATLLSRHNQAIIQERRMRESMNRDNMSRSVRRISLSDSLKEEVDESNVSNGHMVANQRKYGSILAYGCNALVSTQTAINKNSHKLLIQNPYKSNLQETQIIFHLLEDDQNIINYIVDPEKPFHIRKHLALYIICFQFRNCTFGFFQTEVGGQLYLKRIQRAPPQKYKNIYFKKWFQWVANHYSNKLKTQNQRFRALALRNTKPLIEKCLYYQKFDDAEFLACIEDQFYQLQTFPANLSTDLRQIALGDISPFQYEHWVFQLAVFLWYFNFSQNEQNTMYRILKDRPQSDQFSLDYHLLKIQFSDQFPLERQQTPTPDDNSQGWLWYWFYSFKLHQTQIDYFKFSNKMYQSYRHNLLEGIVNAYQDVKVAIKLLSYDKFVSSSQKAAIAIRFSAGKKHRLTAFYDSKVIGAQEMKEAEGLIAYEDGNYIQALHKFSQWPRNTGFSPHIIKLIETMVKSEYILCVFHIPTCRKILEYLTSIVKVLERNNNGHKSIIVPYVKKNLDWQTFICLSKLAKNDFEQQSPLKHRIMEIVYDKLMKSSSIRILLKNEPNKFEQIRQVFCGEQQKMLNLHLLKVE